MTLPDTAAVEASAAEAHEEHAHDDDEHSRDEQAHENAAHADDAEHGEDHAAHAEHTAGAPAASDQGEHTAAPEGEEHDDEDDGDEAEEELVESVGGDDVLEEVPERAFRPRRQYKIQEVIKRRQVMLVQVVKEERGNKGAALTTYLSLAGRYAVLMPNTARGGGISRKITSAQDRSRLKEVVQDLDVPEGMGIILRTAGASRTKPEIKRDFEYLIRMWETVRDMTLKSQAPTLVYEEGSLIKRSLRDLYNKEIDEILVAGEAGYREARDFMKMLMPSNVRAVKQYRDGQPLFSRMGVESQLDAMFSPTVQLRSGGYIVINQTEALVSIDVNSGRSTREHHIEDTALKTNLEACGRSRPPASPARPRRPDRDRLHRHGREAQQPLGRAQAVRLPAAGPRANPGRPHLAFRPAGNVAPANSRQRARELDRALPAMRRQRPCPLRILGRAAVPARARGNPDEGRDPQSRGAHPDRRCALCPQPQARPSARSRKQFQGDAGRDRRSDRQRPAIVHHRPRRTGAHAGGRQGAAGGAGRRLPAAQAEEALDDDEPFDPEAESEVETEETEGLADESAAGEESSGEAEAAEGGPQAQAAPAAPRPPRRGPRGCARARRAAKRRASRSKATRSPESSRRKANPTKRNPTISPARFAPISRGGERRPRRRGRRGGRRRRGGPDDGLAGSIADELEPVPPPEVTAAVADFDSNPTSPSLPLVQPESIAPAPEQHQMDRAPPEPAHTAPEPESAQEIAQDAERAAARRRSTVREKVSFLVDAQPTTAPVSQSQPSEPAQAPAPAEQPASETTTEATDDTQPRRAGWWSRRFGNGE